MKKSLFIALSCASSFAFGQNLISNQSFDTNGDKITSKAQIDLATGWSDANGGSVDLFNADACKLTDMHIPDNFAGSQDNSGTYAGMIAYYDDARISLFKTIANLEITDEKAYGKYAEYIQNELTEPLKAGVSYRYSVKVSLADKSGRAVNGLGAYFSKEKVEVESNAALDFSPQVKSSELITDKDGWATIEGTFVAEGGEKFVTFGAFEGSFEAEKIVEDLKENDNRKAYYYVQGAELTTGKRMANFNDLLSGKHIIFLTLNFEVGKANIKAESYDELNACANFLKAHEELDIQVDGHTDATGSDEINLPLSKDRAASVKQYLVNKGIDANRITTEGYGSSQPLYTEQANDVRNRRIELYSVK